MRPPPQSELSRATLRGRVFAAQRRLHLADSHVHTIESGWRPILVRSTCETSEVYGTTSSWGVCSED